jgi:hypothetical protein
MSSTESEVMKWSDDDLRKIGSNDDLHVSPFRSDGKTYGTPTWIWSVVVDRALYVRAYNGRQSRWHEAAITQKAGRIASAGLTKDVVFETVSGAINDPDRRGLSLEVPHQPVSRSHDRRARAIGNRPDSSPLEGSIQRRVTWTRSKFSSWRKPC